MENSLSSCLKLNVNSVSKESTSIDLISDETKNDNNNKSTTASSIITEKAPRKNHLVESIIGDLNQSNQPKFFTNEQNHLTLLNKHYIENMFNMLKKSQKVC